VLYLFRSKHEFLVFLSQIIFFLSIFDNDFFRGLFTIKISGTSGIRSCCCNYVTGFISPPSLKNWSELVFYLTKNELIRMWIKIFEDNRQRKGNENLLLFMFISFFQQINHEIKLYELLSHNEKTRKVLRSRKENHKTSVVQWYILLEIINMQSQDESNFNTSNLKCCSTRLTLRVSFEKKISSIARNVNLKKEKWGACWLV